MNPAERVILRAWLDEWDRALPGNYPRSTRDVLACVATRTGVTQARVMELVQQTTWAEKRALVDYP